MTDIEKGSWPSETDKNRMWDATQTGISRRVRNARRRKVSLLAGATVLTLGVTVGAFILPATHQQSLATIRCYIGESTTSEYSTVPLPDGHNPLSNSAAITSCGTTPNYEKTKAKHMYEASKQGDEAPNSAFAVCLQPDGVIAVFPLTTRTGTPPTPAALCHTLDLQPMTQ
ncbi:hypothetical protein [Arthrobacter sp. ERGS1:01]|uniref:hypothetical protein n=1 Tax=Arthrobacter sp. ERGS1:01 TaxID=1704044 RepID=UPI000A5D25AA|nr:hypothetical protein [Arthrobacter sp. ERGS1:01]